MERNGIDWTGLDSVDWTGPIIANLKLKNDETSEREDEGFNLIVVGDPLRGCLRCYSPRPSTVGVASLVDIVK